MVKRNIIDGVDHTGGENGGVPAFLLRTDFKVEGIVTGRLPEPPKIPPKVEESTQVKKKVRRK